MMGDADCRIKKANKEKSDNTSLFCTVVIRISSEEKLTRIAFFYAHSKEECFLYSILLKLRVLTFLFACFFFERAFFYSIHIFSYKFKTNIDKIKQLFQINSSST